MERKDVGLEWKERKERKDMETVRKDFGLDSKGVELETKSESSKE